MKMINALLAAMAMSTTFAFGAGGEAFTDPAKAGPDFAVQGEYEGSLGDKKFGLQVIALSEGKFDAVAYRGGLPGAGWNKSMPTKMKGETTDGVTNLHGLSWDAKIDDGVVTGQAGLVKVNLKKVERKSPTLGAKPPANATVLFDGSNIDAWESGKLVEEGKRKYPRRRSSYQREVPELHAASGISHALHAEVTRPGPGQQWNVPARSVRVSGARLIRP